MAEFLLKIAGHTAAVTSLFESTPQYFRAYLTEEAPAFSVTVTRENIDFEQSDLLAEAHRDGFKPRVFTDPFLERAAIQRAFAEFLFSHNTLLFHGSAIAVDGAGFLFTAHSGTGKSTHTRLWREVFGERAVMVNDDKPFLELAEGVIWLHGSPWSGKHGLDANIRVPLRGICVLERGAENSITHADSDAVLPMLRKQAYAPLEANTYPQFLHLTEVLSRRVPLWKMKCNKESSAAVMAHSAMSGI
jgi:hypothetical protein